MKALGLAFGLGLIAALAFPPLHLVPVLLVSIPGLLALIGRAGSLRAAALIGFVFGWGQAVGGLYWITYAILTEVERYWWLVPIAVPALAIPVGAFAIIPAVAARWARPGWPRLLAFAGAWVLAEMLRGVAPFGGFAWNLMGSVWAFAALPIQGAALVGVHGLSLATLVLAGLPLLGRRAVAGGAVALALLAGLSWARLGESLAEPGGLRVLLVQGNISQDMAAEPAMRVPIFRRYLELTAQGLAGLPPDARAAVVWPEAASPFRLVEDPGARAAAGAALTPGAVLLAGSVTVEWTADGRPERLFNSLVAVTPAGALAGRFDKAHLVPFGEYMPLRGLLPVRLVQSAFDYTPGPGLATLAPAGLPAFSPLICYEVVFPGAVVGPTRPAWLVNITNDAWFGVSAGPYQHLASARLRAVEEGLPLARAAQTGISALFDPWGRRIVSLGLGEEGSVAVPLPQVLPPTIFARYGVVVPGFLALVALMLGLLRGRRGSERVRTSHQ